MTNKFNISEKEAKILFEDSNKVLEMISKIKWEDGFVCKKCSNTNYCEGKTPFSRRCTRCKKEESASAHTIFHNIKFPINKAFYIAYHVCAKEENYSSYTFADELNLNQMTCWKFKKRINECVKNISPNTHAKTLKGILFMDFSDI